MRNKLKKIVGTLLTFALAFTIFGGEAKNVSAATSAIVSWSGKESVRKIGTSSHVGYILLDRAIVDALPEITRAEFGILYEISETGPAPVGNGMTAEYANLVTAVTGLTNDAVYLLPLNRPGGAPQAISADAGTMVEATIMGVLLAIEKTPSPYWYFNYYDTDAIDFGNEGGGTLPLSLNKPTLEIKDLPNVLGIIEFLKHDGKGSVLEGAVFELYAAEDTSFEDVIATAESDSNGVVRFTDVEEGSYKIKESAAPTGYIKSTTVLAVSITEDGETVTPEGGPVVNTRIKADVVVTKLGETPEVVLPGAEFTLYENGIKVGESKVTGLNGTATFEDIPYGTYTMKETKAPVGYVLSEEVEEVEIEDVDDVNVTFSNVKIMGTVQITKVDMDDHEIVLQGAKFEIVDNNSPAVFEGTTGVDGMLEIKLPFGEYTLSEIAAPAGYDKATGTWPVSITENEELVELMIGNEKIEDVIVDPTPDEVGTLRITKVDKEDHEIVLKGAKFLVVDEEGETIFEGTTDEDGMLETELLVGKYTLSEVTAPKDYENTTETWSVNIKKDKEIVALVIENEMIEIEEVDPLPLDDEMGTVRIKKVDKETDAALAGVKFRITDKDGDVVFEGLTDAKGMIEEELLVGEYTITEVEALPGYVPNTESEVVMIEEDGEVVNLTIANKKMYGLVSIKKVDAESGEVLEGAKFKIVDKAGVVILEDYTDEEGMLEVWLPKGEYVISETEAPEDYDKTDETWSVKVSEDGQLFKLEVENTMIEVEAVSPVTLPQTGGIPSEFLYVLGAFAIFTGMLLTKKRQRG